MANHANKLWFSRLLNVCGDCKDFVSQAMKKMES